MKRLVICLVIAGHFAVDAMLLAGSWEHFNWLFQWTRSECSLVALWAAFSRRSVGFRAGVAFLGVTAAWLVHSRVEEVLVEHRWLALVFATGYFVHAITIVVLVMLCGYMARLIRRQIVSDEAGHARRPQFSLGSMLVWTAIVAIGLGVGTTSFAGVRLPPNFFSHFVPTQCLSAGLDAGFAVLLLWSLVGPWRWVFPKVVLGLAIIACGVYLSRFLFGLIDPIYLYPPVVETGRVLKGFYVATLCLTLVPLRLAGYFGVEKRDLHAPRSRLGRDNPSIC